MFALGKWKIVKHKKNFRNDYLDETHEKQKKNAMILRA
jgi:hypothetical protein